MSLLREDAASALTEASAGYTQFVNLHIWKMDMNGILYLSTGEEMSQSSHHREQAASRVTSQ